MKLAEIEERLAQVDVAAGQDLIYELLAAYGTPQASITKLRTGTYNKSNDPDVVLWKRKVWDTYQPEVDESELIALVDRAQADGAIAKLKPRFVIARSDQRLVAVDSRIGQSLDIELSDLPQHAAFFMPWTGAEKVRSETISYVDTKVAQQMAKLYDEIVATNTELPASDDGRRDLNVFFSRLLFCFFAEDTGVFEDGIFTDGLNQLTATDGSDTADFLDQLFVILDTAPDDRGDVPAHFGQFGYVNGSLFADRIVAPIFSRKARNIVVDCGTLDWSSINPDIFGSMIQAVTAGEDRSALGMHYTSVENILKVLNPLFLDDLEERYEDAQDSVRKLEKLHEHLGGIKVFDPACGSGNFLIVAYKRLRTIEHRILQRLVDLDAGNAPLFADSKISLENFFGIEIDDFAHDIAKLSLWFAKHQMNQHYDDIFGIERPLIPLTETGAIFCGNAVQLDWPEVCPPTEMTYLCGNPPFVGSKNQTTEQRADFATYFSGQSYSKELDYVCLWFLKGADYINLKQTSLGFVSTNSTCQGRHVPLFWPLILARGVGIKFAHTSFLWSNKAVGGAGVTCVVVGLSSRSGEKRTLFSGGRARRVDNINPYLVASPDDTIVEASRQSLSNVAQPMTLGVNATDGGHLMMDEAGRNVMISADGRAAKFIRTYVGASDLLRSEAGYCLWISDEELHEAQQIAPIADRLKAVATFRQASKKKQTRALAQTPHRYARAPHQDAPCIGLPRVTSERREYVPLAPLASGVVASQSLFVVYDAHLGTFAVLHSAMHMAWIRTVSGRMKSDYSYSATLAYNTFPFADTSFSQKDALANSALDILAARERWPDRSLAELYDPDKMPANLRAAHKANDALVDSLYRSKPFKSDADRMELLLANYRDLVAEVDSRKSKKD